MAKGAPFEGFNKKSLKFFRDLKKNNNKAWFDANRNIYQEEVIEPARLFISAMGSKLKRLAPDINADPRVNKSIFRINRDIRFSKDKIPYKTNFGIWFWEGAGKRMERSGFYFHLDPPNLMLGTGIYCFPKTLLTRYRDAVVAPKSATRLRQALSKVQRAGAYNLGGGHYKRVPRGYDPDHENAEYLKHNGLWAGITAKIPEQFYSSELLDYCYHEYKAMAPLHRWLNSILD